MFKKLLSQTLIYGLSNVLGRVFPFMLTPVLTQKFGPEFFAPFVDFYSAAVIIIALLSHGMETSVFKFVNEEEEKEKVYSTALISILFISSLFLYFGLTNKETLAIWFKNADKAHFVAWFILILSIDAICSIPFAKLRVEEKALQFGGIKIINAFVFFFLSLFFLLGLPLLIEKDVAWAKEFYNPNYGVGYVFLANLLASAFTLLLLLPTLFKIKLKFDFKLWKKIMPFAFPIMIASLAAGVNQGLDRQFLKYLLPEDQANHQLGVYGGIFKITTFMLLFRQAYLLGIEPFFFSHAKNKNAKDTYAVLMKYFVIINCLILVFLIGNISFIKYYLRDPAYWEGLYILPIILVGAVFLGIYMNLSIWYKLTNKTYFGALFSVLGAAVTIAINFTFIPQYGYLASAWGNFLAYFTMCVVSYFFGRKYYDIPYDMKKIGFYILFSIGLSLLSFYTFKQSPIIGNLLLLIYLAAVFSLEKSALEQIWSKKNES